MIQIYCVKSLFFDDEYVCKCVNHMHESTMYFIYIYIIHIHICLHISNLKKKEEKRFEQKISV